MRWFTCFVVATGLAFGNLAIQPVLAQEDGESLLDEAVEKKLDARTPRDLDRVADLCEEAIEKGLSDESLKTATELWAGVCMEHARILTKRIFRNPPDTRWKFLRQQALERLEKNVELKPENSEAWLMIAKLELLDGGDKEAAGAAVTKALESSGDDLGQQAETLILRSQTTRDKEQQWADINKAMEVDPTNEMGLGIRGRMYEKEEKYDEAIEDFAKLAKQRNNQPLELLVLAERMRNDGNDEVALKAVSRAIEINEDLPAAYSFRATLYFTMEKDDEAMADVTRAIELNPKDIEGLRTRARYYLQNEKYEDALKDVEKILTFREGDVDAILLRSLIYAGMENYEAAIEDMELLVREIPGEPMLRNALAGIYMSADQHEKAIEIYDEALEEDPEDQQALAGRGDAKLNAGMHAEAVKDYEAALELDKEDDHVLNNLAWVLCTSTFDEVRDGKRAVELANKAAEVTEFKEAHILSTLAAAYAETGDFENAVKWSEKSVEIASDGRQKEDLQKELETFKAGNPVRENEAEERKKKKAEEEEKEEGDSDEDAEDKGDDSDEDKEEKKDGGDDKDDDK